jgi:hypothetical protein
MTKPSQEFTIQVQSEDPEDPKKDKPSNDKPNLAGSNLSKDAKPEDGNSEELVRDYTIRIRNIFYHDIIVGGGPATQGSVRNAGRAIEGLTCIFYIQQITEYSYQESNAELYRATLETLRILIRTSTSSMTSVPKPLKFLRPHYIDLQALYETWSPSEDKVSFAASAKVLIF